MKSPLELQHICFNQRIDWMAEDLQPDERSDYSGKGGESAKWMFDSQEKSDLSSGSEAGAGCSLTVIKLSCCQSDQILLM